MKPTDWPDVQRLILFAYKELEHAQYLMLSIEHPGLFKQWLEDNISGITHYQPTAPSSGFNIAFTATGLEKLGLSSETYHQFSREFKEGIATQKRSLLLGDTDSNDPEHWSWGGTRSPTIDVLLLCFEKTKESLVHKVSQRLEELEAYTTVIQQLPTQALSDRKEHFGFSDGLSQPKIEGAPGNSPSNSNDLKAGEFLLGHTSNYGTETPFPSDNNAFKNFGYNGSYLVFRQLEQHVRTFWQYLDKQNPEEDDKVFLASKMVGRWPNGAPLSLYPTVEPLRFTPQEEKTFDYSDDPQGNNCPMASHIRRSNPRATDLGLSNKECSLNSANHHRIIRRGRPYGKPLHTTLSPTSMLKADDTEEKRGLNFLCFNADIARQFEFIQQTWIHNAKFNGLYNDLDPLLGTREQKGCGDDFTIPQQPIRKRLKALPQFVTTKGGAYFFMPSISALKQLAN